MADNNTSNKNIWLAISLAIITSLTSVVTAVINKEKEPSASVTSSASTTQIASTESIVTEFKVFQEKYKNDIKRIEENIKENGKNLDLHKVVVSQTRNTNNLRFGRIEEANKNLLTIVRNLRKEDGVIKEGVYNYVNDKIREASSKSISRDIEIQKGVDKNTSRSIMCYVSLTKEEVQKGKSILSIINGEGINKSLSQQKSIDNILKHLDQSLLKKINNNKYERNYYEVY